MKFLLILLVATLFGLAGPVHAQQRIPLPSTAPAKQQTGGPTTDGQTDELRVLHVTDRLDSTEAARAALRAYHEARAAGRLNTAAKRTAVSYAVGEVQTFRVLKNVSTNATWEEQSFELKATSGVANIWVAVTELSNGHVEDSDVTALSNAMLQATPAKSVNPGQGIVANNNAYFGNPPNVDGDGKLDVLLYNIVEGGTSEGSFIAGYVTSRDLSATGGGNNRDVLYLDTDPGITKQTITAVLGTAAHEYQHLIHYAYDLNEETFVNEGLSEWAEVLNGYEPRGMTYLLDADEYNTSLRRWSQSLEDYQRAGLFTSYLAQRLGAQKAASITRQATRGIAGYDAVLAGSGLSVETVLPDFHAANYLNDTAVDANLGYADSRFDAVGATDALLVDGRGTSSTPETSVQVDPGAVQYLTWRKVQDLAFSIDVASRSRDQDKIHVRALIDRNGGAVEVQDFGIPQSGRLFSGAYERITLVVSHVRADLTLPVSVSYSATWGTASSGTITSRSYDDGTALSDKFFTLSAGAGGAVATRFEVPTPDRAVLDEVLIAPYFLSQFDNTGQPETAARDVKLKIWAEAAGGGPGQELFSLNVTDPRAYSLATTSLNHFSVDLSDHRDQLDNLPARIYVGFSELGSDQNYMVVSPASYTTENVSFVTNNNGTWRSLWETQFQDSGDDEFPLRETVVPIRVNFLVLDQPVAVEDGTEVPDAFDLEQNYPNPFNPATTIAYSLTTASPVRLEVYDLLGRRVAILIEGMQPAGRHTVTFQAEGLSSGTYLYALEAEGRRLTRRMTLVK